MCSVLVAGSSFSQGRLWFGLFVSVLWGFLVVYFLLVYYRFIVHNNYIYSREFVHTETQRKFRGKPFMYQADMGQIKNPKVQGVLGHFKTSKW